MLVGVTIAADELFVDLYGVTSEGSRSQPQRMSAYDNDIFLQQLADRSQSALRPEVAAGRITMSLPTLSND